MCLSLEFVEMKKANQITRDSMTIEVPEWKKIIIFSGVAVLLLVIKIVFTLFFRFVFVCSLLGGGRVGGK